MRKLTIFPLAALFAALIASAPAAPAQSASFIISQHGKSVGTASFNFTASPKGYDSTALVIINMKGLDYSLSKTESLSPANHLRQVQLSAAVNGSAVNITAVPETKFGHAPVIVLNTSANGHTTTTRLPLHSAAVFLPDFDPGALETLLVLAVARNNRDLWAIIPKKDGSIEPIQLATYADEKGALGGKPVVVHHLVATIAGSETDLFSGPENQLLQAEFPQIGYFDDGGISGLILVREPGGADAVNVRRCEANEQVREADVNPPENSCYDEMLTLELERLSGKFDAGQQILALQIRKLGRNIVNEIAAGKIFQQRLDRIPETANGRFAVANCRVNRDARQQRVHGTLAWIKLFL